MTGATRFTRMTGAAGMIMALLGVTSFVEITLRDLHPAQLRDYQTYMLTSLAFFAVFAVGLLVRHRGLWWARGAATILALSVVVVLIYATGDSGPTSPDVVVAIRVATLTLYGVMLGVLVAGELPRPATFVVLLSQASNRGKDPFVLEVATDLIGLVGFAWLAWVMWREPLDDSGPREEMVHGSPVPA